MNGRTEAVASAATTVLPGVVGTMSGNSTIHGQVHEMPLTANPSAGGQRPNAGHQSRSISMPTAPNTS